MTVSRTSPGDAAKIPEDDGAVLRLALEPSERAELVAPAVGSTIILTDRRLLVVRQGAHRRPRTGVKSWAVDHDLMVRLDPQRKRVMVGRRDRFLSIFLRADQAAGVEDLISEIASRLVAPA
jgi:hypothetical protein